MTKRTRRSGATMLELVAATTIITIALVPALRLTRQRISTTRDLELAEVRLSLCTSKLEEELARTAATWDLSGRFGDYAADGYPEIRFRVEKSDDTSDGGLPGSLAAITVTVWHDADAGGDLDTGEQRVLLATKIARLATYEHESGTH